MSWIVGTSDDYIDLSNDIVEACTEESIQSVAVNVGGTTYVVGDIVSLTGGTSTIVAQFEVTSVSGGVVDGIRQFNDGVYTVPTGTTGIATTGAGDNALTVDVTYAENGWAANEDTTWSGSDRVVQLEGSGGGTDEIFVGWRTFFNAGPGYFNWELHGMTGYDSLLPFDEQPGISLGFHDGTTATERSGCYWTIQNASINYWLNVTPYRIICVVKVGARYFPMYLGWGNRFATVNEYPYPILVSGNTSLFTKVHSTTALMSGLIDPWRSQESDGNVGGPMMLLKVDNSWLDVKNATITDAGSNAQQRVTVVVPCGRPDGTTSPSIPLQDQFMTPGLVAFDDFIPPNVTSGGQNYNVHPTEDSGGDLRALWPTMIIGTSPAQQVYMEMDSCFWVSTFGGVTAEDRVIENSEVYRIFPQGIRAENYSFFAIKEQ